MSIHFNPSRMRLNNVRLHVPGTALLAPLAWDPSHSNDVAMLSNNNLTLATSGPFAMTRTNRSFPLATKIYAEFDITGDNNNVRIGLTSDRPRGEIMRGSYGPTVAPIGNYVWRVDPDTGAYTDSAISYAPERPKGPDFVMIAWDGSRFFFGHDGTWVNGNPANGSGGTRARIPGDKFFIGLDFADDPTARATVNFGATPFRYTPPAGYEGWAA